MNLLLIGYRGSGKSAVARLVAERLGWDWVDADVELERRAGKSIAAIFADDGEPVFRDLESQLLAELVGSDRCVLALGGGVILRPENRALIRQAGPVVWLTADADILHARIAADPNTGAQRPNLTAQGGVEEIRRLLAMREPFYRECAGVVVETSGRSVAEVAEAVVKSLRAR